MVSGPDTVKAETGTDERILTLLRNTVIKARSSAEVDETLEFNTHLKYATRSTLQSYPALKLYPGETASIIENISGTNNQKHCMDLLEAITRGKLMDTGHRKDKGRIYRAAGEEFRQFINEIIRLSNENNQSITDILPGSINFDDLADVIAKVFGRYHHTNRGIGSRVSTVNISTFPEKILKIANSWIKHSVFPAIADTSKISLKTIDKRLFALEAAFPNMYTAFSEAKTRSSATLITTEIVQKLQIACKTAREKAYIQLSLSTGLRAEAMVLIEVKEVWIADAQDVVQAFYAKEKNSNKRLINLTDQTRLEIKDYILKEHSGKSPYLFFSSTSPLVPYRQGLRSMLAQLCKRAGVQHMYHHQWRQYITNTIVERGGGIELASKFLGHKDVRTTFQHYLTAVPDIMKELLNTGEIARVLTEDRASNGTTVEMEQLLDQNALLKRKIEELEAENKRLKLTAHVNSESGHSNSATSSRETDHLNNDFEVLPDLWADILGPVDASPI